MDFPTGQRVQRPPDAEASWYAKTLTQIRRHGMGDIPISLEIGGGREVVGHLDRISSVVGAAGSGSVGLAEGDKISCDDIVAFTLLDASDYEGE